MSEFRIHHDVNELLSLLQVRGGDGAEGYIDLLQKHRTPYVTTTVSAHSAKVGHTHTHTRVAPVYAVHTYCLQKLQNFYDPFLIAVLCVTFRSNYPSSPKHLRTS